MANTLSYANSVDVTDAANFIPEVWSNEVLAAYKANLVMAALVTKLNHKGKKGDVIHIPKPTRGSASSKSANNVVTLITNAESEVQVTIDQHWEYSRVIEDITETQALASLRRFFTDDAGYALATRVDTEIHELGATLDGGSAYANNSVIGSDGSTAWDGSANTSTGNGAALTDAGIRRIIQTFDDNDVPMRNRYLVIPPVEKRKLLGESRFTEQAFTGESAQGNSIRNGLVGDVYGVDVFVSSNIPTVQADDSSTNYRPCFFFQKDALVLAEQIAPRVQQQYKLEALGTLMVADTLFGVKDVRPEGALTVFVPA